MTFYLIRFVVTWGIWFYFADKKRWKEIVPVCVWASALAGIADNIVASHKLWGYNHGVDPLVPDLLDNIGIYPVVTYLFIQYLPQVKSLKTIFWHFFKWTALAISIEAFHVYTGHMVYGLWWNTGWSYLADWVLYWSFYKFHKTFEFWKLNNESEGKR